MSTQSKSWTQLVAEGRRLVKQAGELQWAWGDLALEVAPTSGSISDQPHVRTGMYEKLHEWIDEIGYEGDKDTIARYRQVAAAWPPERRSSTASHGAHQVLAGNPNRFKLIGKVKTADDARRLAGHRPNDPITSDERVEQARRVLQDPEIASRALSDMQIARQAVRVPAVRSAMAKAAKEMEDESRQQQRERAPRLVEASDFYEAIGELSKGRRAHIKALNAMRVIDDLDDEQREELQEHLERAQIVLDWIESFLESGDHSFDKELDKLLREEV